MYAPGTNSGHGHVWRRPDGDKASCGGPGVCVQCSQDFVDASGFLQEPDRPSELVRALGEVIASARLSAIDMGKLTDVQNYLRQLGGSR